MKSALEIAMQKTASIGEKAREELEKLRDYAWETCNSEEFKNLRKSWIAGK